MKYLQLFYIWVDRNIRQIKQKNYKHSIINKMIPSQQTNGGYSQIQIDQQNAPHQFMCPISKQIMKDPVITIDGYSFEREVLEKWFISKNTSPITGLKIDKKIIQNRALKQAIKYHNQRDSKANLNAQKLLQNTNQYIKITLPQLLNDVGLIDVNKLVAISIQNLELRKIITSIKKQIKKLNIQSRVLGIGKPCQCCTRMKQAFKTISNSIKGGQNILESQPIIKQLNIEAKQFDYLPLSCNDLKNIDFKYLRKDDFQKKIFKSYGIQRTPLQDLIKRIKIVNKIPEDHYTQIWRVSLPIDKLYQHIKKQVQNQSCTYIRKVKSIGTKLPNLNIKLEELKLGPGQYLIIQNGKQEQFVFRGEINKCRYCYNYKPEKFKCTCQRVSYCSHTCAEKDVQFHVKQCPQYHIVAIQQKRQI